MTPESLKLQRQTWRKTLIAARQAMPADLRAAADAALNAQLRARLDGMAGEVLAFYWPIQAEFDARPAVTGWLAAGGERRAVLPVVIGKDQPLRFRAWEPATVMQAAGFGTSVPSTGEWLVPKVLLIPLVGFDDAGYRLGYGGGYFDRTLAAMTRKPVCIATAFDLSRIDTLDPQAHDVRMDFVLSESGITQCLPDGVRAIDAAQLRLAVQHLLAERANESDCTLR